MPVFKIKDEPRLHDDPFELFRIEATSEPPVERRAAPTRRKSTKPLLPVFFVSFLVLSVTATLMMIWGPGAAKQEAPFAYFEIRAIDDNGRPVTGAAVRNGGKKVGVTDSYGEWRRFMRVVPGSTVAFEITKKTEKGLLSAARNFAVPLRVPAEGDLVIKGSVSLHKATRSPSKTPEGVPTITPHGMSSRDTSSSNDAASSVSSASVPSSASEEPSAVEQSAQSTPDSSAFVSPWSKMWIKSGRASSEELQKRTDAVASAMRTRARQLGLDVEAGASWTVTVTGLVEPRQKSVRPSAGASRSEFSTESPGESGLIHFQSEAPGFVHNFLRNFEAEPMTTARGALHVLSLHTERDFVARLQGQDWVVETPENARLWPLITGRALTSAAGKILAIDGTSATATGVRLLPSSARPCEAAQSSCLVFRAGLGKSPPVSGWTRQKTTLPVTVPQGAQVFVSGYEALSVRATNQWEYWGTGTTAPNVTVLVQGRIHWRGQAASRLAGSRPVQRTAVR